MATITDKFNWSLLKKWKEQIRIKSMLSELVRTGLDKKISNLSFILLRTKVTVIIPKILN